MCKATPCRITPGPDSARKPKPRFDRLRLSMLLGELDLNANPAVDAFNKLDDRQRKTTSSLGKLGGQLVSLAAGYLSLTAILHGFESALDLGSTLHDTSLRTGETVGDLVGLREAFQEAGLGADGVE